MSRSNRSATIGTRLVGDDLRILDDVRDRLGLSRSAVLREALRMYLAEYETDGPTRVVSLTATAVVHDAERDDDREAWRLACSGRVSYTFAPTTRDITCARCLARKPTS